jgi:hypothetical protein
MFFNIQLSTSAFEVPEAKWNTHTAMKSAEIKWRG